jgi:hypothetical protein
MFIRREWRHEEGKFPEEYDSSNSMQKNLIFIGVILFLLGIVFLIVYLIFFRPEKTLTKPVEPTATSTEINGNFSRLPEDLSGENKDSYYISSTTGNIKIEDLTFGYFYEPKKEDFDAKPAQFELPLNVKVDAANYYDLSRKLKIDDQIEYVNKYGFAIFDNQIKEGGNNFFAAYRGLVSDDIPIVLTTDFIYYYYQNELKQVFREIEKNTFYENVWDINKKLYDIALTRYKNKVSEAGLVNDPVLEGERLELVYFAVALKLLTPSIEQINKNASFIDEKKFSEQEADSYNFILPSYISEDVEKEVALIRAAQADVKSPSFLYNMQYKRFRVPSDYGNSAKLTNFYLTMKWFNSVFPLYYKSETCPDCLLDYEDWVVNMAAASFISKDIYDNPEIKNQWAIIYKFIAFYSGLRADLTYLHYNDALTKIFGENYSVEKIFSSANGDREKKLIELRDELLENDFLPLEGGMKGFYEKPELVLGLRILQEPYWPDDYLFRELSGTDLKQNLPKEFLEKRDKIITSCKLRLAEYYRCTGYSLDLVSLIYPVKFDDEAYRLNTMYDNFSERKDTVASSFDKFDVHTWNSNIYWASLDISKKFFSHKQSGPTYALSKEWQDKKDLNTTLGAWVNMHLMEDRLVSYAEKTNSRKLGAVNQCNKYNYIEPNLAFLNDLVAKNDMLIKMLTVLKSVGNTNTAVIQLKDLNKKLNDIITIVKKQLNNETISDDDCRIMTELASGYAIDNKRVNFFSIKPDIKKLEEKIEGVKLLMIYYKNQDKNILGVGPIFNFSEKSFSVDN